jgi:hypothetical protein
VILFNYKLRRKTMAVATGTIYWACIQHVNAMSGKYELDLSLTKDETKAFKDEGIEVKKDSPKEGQPDKGLFVKMKSNYPAKVVDSSKSPIDGKTVGNGSKVKVVWNPYDWNFKGKKGTSAGFTVVQVLDLVEYNVGSLDELDDDTATLNDELGLSDE